MSAYLIADLRRLQRDLVASNFSPVTASRLGTLITELEWKAKQVVAVREGQS